MDKRMMNRELRVKKVNRDKFNLIVVATIILVTILVICSSLLTSAEEETILNSDKYYSSIQIEPDDTLWDIAKRYNQDEEISTMEYVEEIMQVNGLATDKIYEGQYIIVMCSNK